MRNFVELDANNVVRAVFTFNVPGYDPVFEPQLKQPVETTGLDPQPDYLWVYDPDTSTFTAP